MTDQCLNALCFLLKYNTVLSASSIALVARCQHELSPVLCTNLTTTRRKSAGGGFKLTRESREQVQIGCRQLYKSSYKKIRRTQKHNRITHTICMSFFTPFEPFTHTHTVYPHSRNARAAGASVSTYARSSFRSSRSL